MTPSEQARYREATAIFRMALKASQLAVHRTLGRPPKGKGWVQCHNSPPGLMCRPQKLREALALFQKAYDIFPDIVAVNQLALGYEMLGETDIALRFFRQMHEQARREENAAYVQAAEVGLARLGASSPGKPIA